MLHRVLNSPLLVFIGLWALNLLLLGSAYQTRFPITLDVSGDNWLYQNQYLENFGTPSESSSPRFRYASAKSEIRMPALGQATPLALTLRLNAWYPEGARNVTLTVNHQIVRRVTNGEWKNVSFVITDTARLNPNLLTLAIESDTFVPHDYDANNPNTSELGAAVESLTLVPRTTATEAWWLPWTTPAWDLILMIGLLATAAYGMAVWLGAPRIGVGIAIVTILWFAIIIAFVRIAAVSYLVPVAGVLLIALLMLSVSRVSSQRAINARTRLVPLLLVLGVVCLAWGVRLGLAWHLPLSDDEQVYVPVSSHYAELLSKGQWSEISLLRENFEHPLFTKLLFAASILIGKSIGVVSELWSARFVSVTASTLLTALLAFVNPLAAATFAIHSVQIQYSSQAYLEAVPAFTITLTMVAFERAVKRGWRWLIVSAICLGLTAASKYIYAVAGFAIIPFLLWRYRRQPLQIILYGALALGAFYVADPFLWTNPLGQLLETLRFHEGVSSSELVNSYARPFYWHLLYLTRVTEWDAGFPFFSFDTLIFIAGILGLPALWRTSRLYLVWFLVALIFLFLWNTKWEQYALTLITPLCLSAGAGLVRATEWLTQKYHARTQLPHSGDAIVRS